MKPSTVLAQAGVLAAAPAQPGSSTAPAPVPLAAPANWRAGAALFPGRILEGFGAPHASHTRRSWAAHVLAACRRLPDCNATLTFAVRGQGADVVGWVGYAFWGPHTDPGDYDRSGRVADSLAYNVVRLPAA